VLSARADEDLAQQARQAGAQAYRVKRPQEIPAAARAVRDAIERQNLKRALPKGERRFTDKP